jgi:GAF domain-containing protein
MVDPVKQDAEKRAFRVFEEGKRFAEDLIKENERLRLVNVNLKNEIRAIENQYIKLDVVRLHKKLELIEKELLALRQENQELKQQFVTVEEENRDFSQRYSVVERQHAELVNLYVCMYRLHATIEYEQVIQTIKEIVISLLGADSFGIYLRDGTNGGFRLVGHEGIDQCVQQRISFTEGIIGNAITTGESYIDQNTTISKSNDMVIACIPLKIGNRVLGALLVFDLLKHKQAFNPIDFELFEILGSHAATAISVSKMYTSQKYPQE